MENKRVAILLRFFLGTVLTHVTERHAVMSTQPSTLHGTVTYIGFLTEYCKP